MAKSDAVYNKDTIWHDRNVVVLKQLYEVVHYLWLYDVHRVKFSINVISVEKKWNTKQPTNFEPIDQFGVRSD